MRPAEYATDEARIELALIHALWELGQNGESYDLVVLLQNSSPLRTSDDIDFCVNLLEGHTEADSVASAYMVEHEHPLRLQKIGDRGMLQPFWKGTPIYRRQDLPPVYVMNGAVYVVRRDYLIEHERVIGDHVLPYIMPHYRSLDVHSEVDLYIAEVQMQQLQRKAIEKHAADWQDKDPTQVLRDIYALRNGE